MLSFFLARFLPCVPLFVALVSPTHAAAAEEKPLVMGFFPIISTVALFKRFSPLKDYLSEQLGREIILETAKDFPTFLKRTAERRYDIVFTAPHFAVRAEDSGKYHIRATHPKDVQVLIVVHQDSPIQHLSELAGKRVSSPPAGALMTMIGQDHVKVEGLVGDKQPRYQAYTSHNAANQAVVVGQADAAIASNNVVLKQMEKGVPLRIISRGLQLPSMATLVASDLPPNMAQQMVDAMVGMSDTVVGRRILKVIGFSGYREVSIKDYEVVRPYAYRSKKKS